MLKQSGHLMLQSHFNYAFIAPKNLKHEANMYIKPE